MSRFLLLCGLIVPLGLSAAPASRPPAGECKARLLLIYDGIQQYRRDHKELPKRLSDMVPEYFADPGILYCPLGKLAGTSSGAMARNVDDPNTSYFFEFHSKPLDVLPGRTNREWKQAQMSLLGSEVPIVRCLLHPPMLNLSFGGRVYESGTYWESNFTSVVNAQDLQPQVLLKDHVLVRVVQIPIRPASAPATQIDLSDFYNGSVQKAWLTDSPHLDLIPLASGAHPPPSAFDCRGVIQLAAKKVAADVFPREVQGIVVRQACRKLRFLHGAAGTEKQGTVLGRYVVHYADGEFRDIPIAYGRDLGNAWRAQPEMADAQVAWEAQGTGSERGLRRLYELTWDNPRGHVPVLTLDFVSHATGAAPFLVAITVEP
jgi:hypothetical protein